MECRHILLRHAEPNKLPLARPRLKSRLAICTEIGGKTKGLAFMLGIIHVLNSAADVMAQCRNPLPRTHRAGVRSSKVDRQPSV